MSVKNVLGNSGLVGTGDSTKLLLSAMNSQAIHNGSIHRTKADRYGQSSGRLGTPKVELKVDGYTCSRPISAYNQLENAN